MIIGSNKMITEIYIKNFPKISINEKKLFIYANDISRLEWKDKLLKYVDVLKTQDRILFDSSPEAIPHVTWEEIDNFLLNHNIKNYLFIDSGIDTNFLYKSIYHYHFLKILDNIIVPSKERTKLYMALARFTNSKFQRIYLINELFNNNLFDDGVITCQSAIEENPPYRDKNEDYYKIFSNEFTNMLPICQDGLVNMADSSFNLPNFGHECLINIIMESSYDISRSEKYPIMLFNGGFGWDRPFLTEKTSKAFNLGQMPIFLSVKGYVNIIRTMGFDVFDDIIDHRYDNEDSPDKRISLIVEEVKRLKKIGLDKLKNINGLDERFEYNKRHVSILREQFKKKYNNYINSWFFSDIIK